MHTDPPRDRRAEYRPIMVGLTVLAITGILATACMPIAARRPAEPAAPVTAQPRPQPPAPAPAAQPPKAQPEQPKPQPTEPPKPGPAKPLPDLPVGAPSRLVVNGDRACKQIAFTYDAGSGADGAAAILDMLKKHGVTSTFFLTGKWVEKYPDLAKRIAAEGHEIANHTYSHPDLTKLPPDEVIKEIKGGEAAIKKVTGQDTRLFREPYGAFNEAERRLVRQAGYSYSIYWDLDTLDWQFPPLETLVSKLTEKTQGGSIVLMHLNAPDSAKSSDRAIPVLRQKGYQLVTVSQLLQCKP
ncbi:MAG TPA: polysaccharide deacetylase family protein [Symbiobacteriaceae bacterium]|nr:polysaccharide deacetylase family protein [Symbiobacteriaceae bacterium]